MGQELSTCQFVSNIMIFRSFVGPQRSGLIGVLRKG